MATHEEGLPENTGNPGTTIPEGWKLVPDTPPRMGQPEDWLQEIREEFTGSVCSWATIDEIYQAIICRAPKPPLSPAEK